MKKSLLFLFLLVLGVTQGWSVNVNVRFYCNNGTFVDGTTRNYKQISLDDTQTFRNQENKFPEVIRTGYTFKGWATNNGADMNLDDKPATTPYWYAQWTPNQYNVTFNWNNGTESETIQQTYDANYELPTNRTFENLTFAGWYNGKTNITNTTKFQGVDDNLVLNARWSLTVTYDSNGGSNIANANKTTTVFYGEKCDGLLTPTRSNCTFVGWNTQADGKGDMITADNVVNQKGDITLYAQWGATLTFNPNNGTIDESAKTRTLLLGEKYGELPVPTREGYIFNGWYTAATGGNKVGPDTEITANQTLNAQWVNTLTVKFDLQDGNASPASDITVKVGSTYSYLNDSNNEHTLQEFPFAKKNGYLLEGWYTEPNGQGLKITPSTIVSVENASAGMKLYANWEALNNTMSGTGTVSDPYIIMTPAHLQLFARLVNEGYVDICGQLGADINMSGIEWIPIGASYIQNVDDIHNAFTGTFDGNGYIVSNLKMTAPTSWDPGYGRSGLIGYAKGATIKNVIVNGTELYAKWNNAAVCGRMDGKGTISNCGSFGTMTYGYVTTDGLSSTNNIALNARAVAGVATTYNALDNSNPAVSVSNVWSTYGTKSDTNNNRSNYVIGSATSATNTSYSNYTQNSGAGTAAQKKTWIYVTSDEMRQEGALCYALNGNVDGGATWTQTFGEIEYANCPRPTNRGLAVYKEGEKYYNRKYTYTFDSKGGSECPDLYVKRYSDNATLVYPAFAQPTNTTEYTFVRWADADDNTVTADDKIEANQTFHAHWSIGTSANVDPDNQTNSYVTFYDSKYAYAIPDGVKAYKGKVSDGNLVLTAITTGVIPMGEAVILKSATPGALSLVTVESDDAKDSNNILEGSDKDLSSVPTNCYILTYGYNKLGFYEQPTSTPLKAHKAYVIWGGQTSLAKCLTMKFEDEATGVEDMTVTENIDKDIYNLNGMRLTKLQKGINIVGGNKVVVK